MINAIEDMHNEFKIKITEKLEQEVVSFLNTDGGNIYIGVDDKGNVIGLQGNLDLLQRQIKDRILNNIEPSALDYFKIKVLEMDNKKYIKIIIKKGKERPYYIDELGMTPRGCFVRVGSAIQSLPKNLIMGEYKRRVRYSLVDIPSRYQKLSFSQLKIFYEEKGYEIGDNFLEQLHCYNDQGKFNLVAYLLSDNNTIPIRFGKYNGPEVYELIEKKDFGCCCLVKTVKNILDFLKNENKIYTKIEYPERKEIKMYDYDAVREAAINALVHNDWTDEFAPKFEIFSDKIVISSHGGLQENVTKKGFFEGKSHPRNPELMKVFCDLELVEQMGTGIRRILKSYDKKCFNISRNDITVSFPFNRNTFEYKEDKIKNDEFTEIELGIINIIMKEPNITQKDLASRMDIGYRTVQRYIGILINKKIISRDGSKKSGKWMINEVD